MTSSTDSRNLRISFVEAFFSSLMIGAGETFFAAFALSKGLGEVLSGLVIGLPMMMGASLQTLTPGLFARFARTKRWVLIMASLQALTLLALVAASRTVEVGSITIFILIGLYWCFAFAGGNVWNYWMGFLVTADRAPIFFTRRLRVVQYGILMGLLAAGFFLQHASSHSLAPEAYLFPFFFAFLARLISIAWLYQQDPIPFEKVKRRLSFNVRTFMHETLVTFQENPQARSDLIFLFLFNSTIFISSSFVTPFLLVKLRFEYLSFMAAQMALYLGKIFGLLMAQRWMPRFGVRKLLFWGALGMSPLPALWLVIEHTSEAVLLQAVSGFCWGLFEVAVGIVMFSELPHQDKIQLLTWNSFFQTSAILIGTLIGGKILAGSGETVAGYFMIFAIGAALRTGLVIASRSRIVPKSKIFLKSIGR